MAYMTYQQQIETHVRRLRELGFDVNELTLRVQEEGKADFIRCCALGQQSGRGKLAYKTTIASSMQTGLVGIGTWYRAADGRKDSFQTYGLKPNVNDLLMIQKNNTDTAQTATSKADLEKHKAAARDAYGFWYHSPDKGGSDYLDEKQVGAYDIRFRNNKYGRVAVVPMRDINGFLWNRQLLNPKKAGENNKIFVEDARVEGLFHALQQLVNGKPFGIAESYVTAATCFELTGMPMVCAFSSGNLLEVAVALRKKYPDSFIFICADNDRHLVDANTGLVKAKEVVQTVKRSAIVLPEFGDLPPGRDLSDWNDLRRERGVEFTKTQILSKMQFII